MQARIAPNTIFRNFLRNRLSDINASRSGGYIYDDFPETSDLGTNSFPRISIIHLSLDGEEVGMGDTMTFDKCLLQVDVWAKIKEIHSLTVTSEAVGTVASTSNSNRLTLGYIPTSVTNIKHTSTSYTVVAKNSDALFTTPASLSSGTIEYSKETGNLNFSSADVSGHAGESITSTYVKKMQGDELAKYYAFEIKRAVKNYWKTDAATTFNGLKRPVLREMGPIDPPPEFEELGIARWTLTYQVEGYNLGEGI